MDVFPSEERYLDQAFSKDGWLSLILPTYLPREGQVRMARAVDDALSFESRLLVEAPTGIGKSLAYLVPATYRAVSKGKRLVVATSNIALQEQLTKKDLPTVAAAVPWNFKFEIYKGNNNYLCLYRLDKSKDSDWLQFSSAEEARMIQSWAASTKTGDVSELDFQPSNYVWSNFSVSAEECLGGKCPYLLSCHSERAKTKVEQALVVVTNYHALLANAVNNDKVLPHFDFLVLDEAHKLVDIARDFFGFSLSESGLSRTFKQVREHGNKALKNRSGFERSASIRVEAFFSSLERFRTSGSYKTRLRRPPPVDFEDMLELLREAKAHVENMCRFVSGDDDSVVSFELSNLKEQFDKCAKRLLEVSKMDSDTNIYHLESDGKGKAKICSKRLDVSQYLRTNLFGRREASIATSATLCTSGTHTKIERKDFAFIAEAMGIPEADCLSVESPFDWPNQAHLIVPKPDTFPDPRDPGYKQAVGHALVDIVNMAQGRTLALFTSWSGLNAAREMNSSAKASSEPSEGDFRPIWPSSS